MEDSMEVLKGLHITSLDEEESEQSDVDDINDDDDDEVCIPATLGFVEKPEKPWALLRQIFPSKTGGTPAWLDPINLPSGRSFICDFCEEPLQFLLQVYAPISEKEYSFHRVLYVFTCMSMTCLLRDQHEQWEREPQKPLRSVKVWRCQLPRTNQFYSSNPPKYDGSDRPLGIGAPLCTWCGTWKGDKVCSSCKHARYCSEKHQAINWRSGHKLKCRQITASSSPCSMSSKEIQEVASMSLWPEFEIKIEDECESNVEIPQGQVVTGKSDLDESEGGDEDEISWATFLERIGRAPEQVISWATFQERVGRAPEQVISVLVHSGGVHGGHYYAYIRPTLSDQWIKFDDERVTKEDMKRALEEQYGGEEELPQTNPGFNNMPFKFTKYSNAYMLVYIRESDKEKILCNVDEKDIAEHLRERLKREQEEKEHKKKEKAEAHLYTIIKVARDEDLAEQIGKEIYFDLVDHEKVKCFRIQKQMPFNLFKEEVAKEFGIPSQFQRFWLWAKRQNHTYRPNRPLTPHEEAQSVGQLREVSNKAHNAELKLFLEVEIGVDLQPIPPPDKTKEDILLFFKLYDPEKEELRYVGQLFVKAIGKPMGILNKLNQMAGYAIDEEIELYEEIKFEPNVMCEHIDKKLTFRACQLEDGDIICFQKLVPAESVGKYRYADVPSFLDYVHNRQVVHFRSLERPKEDDFCLELSKLHTYDDVVERVARQLGLEDPSKIRLTSHNCYSQQPKPQPIKYRGLDHLSDMLVHYNQSSDILYYEVLDIPLPELQGLKTLKVAFHHATKDEVTIHTIRLPKQSTVGDVLTDLRTKVELSHLDAELRLLEVFYHKIYKIFPPGEKIENINDQYWTLRAEEIPEEEKNLDPQDRLIHVYHFTKETPQNQMQIQNFGEPFFLVIHEGETLADIKVRIQKKLQVPDEEFAKWKFAFLSLGRPEYLLDTDIVSSRFQRRDVYGAWEQYLGLEHSDNAPKRTYTANQNRHIFEKPVKIYN